MDDPGCDDRRCRLDLRSALLRECSLGRPSDDLIERLVECATDPVEADHLSRLRDGDDDWTHELHVYLSLTDGHGTLTVALACVTVDEGEQLFRGEAEIEFEGPLQVVEMQFVFPNARFPRAGEYRFQLSALGQVLRGRRFLVTYI